MIYVTDIADAFLRACTVASAANQELNDAAFDSQQAQTVLGWQPKVDLAEGLAATLRASRQDRSWQGRQDVAGQCSGGSSA